MSGISSGAYMAGQFHLAFSTTVVGAGVVAGGPWGCASNGRGVSLLFGGFDNATRALAGCMKVTAGAPDGVQLADAAATLADRHRIDPLTGLAGDRVYLFHGEGDSVVAAAVATAAEAFYRSAGIEAADLRTVYQLPGGKAGHALVVEQEGSACEANASPFIADCDYDQAGEILRWIYPDLVGRPGPATGRRLVFDQTEFLAGAVGWGLAREGVAYIPAACETTPGCRVHIVFHGCQQSRTTDGIGDLFVERTGYLRYADVNRLVLLYPQTNANTAPNRAGTGGAMLPRTISRGRRRNWRRCGRCSTGWPSRKRSPHSARRRSRRGRSGRREHGSCILDGAVRRRLSHGRFPSGVPSKVAPRL